MIKIWGRNTSSNVQKVMWAVGEIGLPHERIDIGGPFGKNREPPYLAMNPNGLVPTLEEEGGFLLWESNTVVRYLAAKHKEPGVKVVAMIADPHVRGQAGVDHAKAVAAQFGLEFETIHQRAPYLQAIASVLFSPSAAFGAHSDRFKQFRTQGKRGLAGDDCPAHALCPYK